MATLSFICAMEAEAKPLIEKLALRRFSPSDFFDRFPFQFYRGRYRDAFDVTVTIPGQDRRYHVDSIGTEPAAVAAFATIQHLQPDLLVSAGTAGSFHSAGAHVGKVYLSDQLFSFHDHRIPVPGWDQFGKGCYPSWDVSQMARALQLTQANVSSGNSLDFTDDDLHRIRENKAILKEMEVGAIGWVAWTSQTPLFAIKSVTNLIDLNPDSPDEFQKNFSTAVASLASTVYEVLDYLATHPDAWPVTNSR